MVSLKNSNKIIEWLVFFLLILTISNTAQVCFIDTYTYIIVLLFFALYIIQLKKIDIAIFWIFIAWFFINGIYSIVFSQAFVFNRVLGYSIPIFIAYFAMKIVGVSFWEKFEKWIFFLTCISLIFYVGNLAFPLVFENFSSVFGRYIADFYKDARPLAWYAFVYTYSPIDSLDYIRNSGFMWEPGAFAMTSLIAFSYRVCRNNMKLDKHCFVYILAVITTVSSAGILALLVFFIYYFASKKNIFYTTLLAVLTIVGLPYIYELEFMSDKIASYIDNANLNVASYNERLDMYEYNRFQVFEINMKRFLEWPVGYGVNEVRDFLGMRFVGVNGLATFIRMWGVVGIFLLIYGITKTSKIFGERVPMVASYIIMSMLLIMFFSNPIEGSALTWIFILTPFIYRNNKFI